MVSREEVTIKSLDPAFDGYRIAMIGDIHGGSNGGSAENIRGVVAAANAENVDLIVLLGDYVSQSHRGGLLMSVNEIADNLAGLTAKDGVVAVLGNHDFRFDDDKVASELGRVGYRVLQNEVFVVERGGKRLRFAGLQDHLHIRGWQEFSDEIKAVVAPTEGAGDLVILEHSPDVLPLITGDLAVSNDLKLFLAAHTHGGQVWLPIFGRPVVPSVYGQKYGYGHIFDHGTDMFVTSGVGTSVLPFRFMVPPEIMVLTIRSS